MARQHAQQQEIQPPTQRQDDFKAAARGQPVSQTQIDGLNSIRPRLQPAPAFVPPGMDARVIEQRRLDRVNRQIDHEIAFQKRRLQRQAGRSKNDFNKDQGMER